LEDKIIKTEIKIYLDQPEKLPSNREEGTHFHSQEERRRYTLAQHSVSLINSMKMKYYAWTLYYTVSNFDFKNFKNVDISKRFLDIFQADLENFNRNRKYISEINEKALLEKYVKVSYKYFILGAARMINFILILIAETGELEKYLDLKIDSKAI
jgi:hypothetical protein